MKRSVFALFAALALLLAAPVMAQEETVEETQPYEARTNPDARSIAGDSGLTLSGTVVEWNDEQLTVRTATGVEHIQILPDTDKPVELTAGQNVSVDYTRTSQGVMIAQEIRPEGVTTGEETDSNLTGSATATTETATMSETDVTAESELDTTATADVDTSMDQDLDTDTAMNEDFDADASLDTQAEFETDVDTNLDTQADLDTTMDDQESLPATGSELPLVALLGLLSIAAAVGVRSYIR